jgi:hypothetical protein
MIQSKNIFLIATDKQSKLYHWIGNDTYKGGLRLRKLSGFCEETSIDIKNQHIYITSDEEIKEWYIYEGKLLRASVNHSKYELLYGKPVILTTDQDLIKDGIQVIPNEFMEWFVKNPSCEEVEVKKGFADGSNYGYNFLDYKIIIPQEEPKQGTMSEAIKQVINNQLKQETFEEVAERLFDIYSIYTSLGEDVYEYTMDKEDFKEASLEIAKWQQEQINCELSELLEQRNEMLAMLERISVMMPQSQEIKRLIKKVKDNG